MLTAALAGAGAAAIATAAGTRGLIGLLRSKGIVDVPNIRSSHSTPTPRGGGVAIVAGALVGMAVQAWLWRAPTPGALFWIGLGGIIATGFADDRLDLPAAARLLLQCLFAAVVLRGGLVLTRLPAPEPFDIPLGAAAGWAVTLLWVVGVTNIYNFLDGIDGYAAVQGMIACLALVLMLMSSAVAPLLAAFAGACAGFLVYNWHPAKIFMGDTGSTTLGFLVAVSPLHAGAETRHTAVLMGAMTVWFFVSDGAYTLLRRAFRGERFWQPHRTHLYQLWTAAGFRHDQVVRRTGAAAVLLAALATAAFHAGRTLFVWLVLILAVLSFAFYRHKVEALSRARRVVTR